MATPKKQVCRIMVMFPCVDNAAALAVKTAIDESVKDITDSNVNFSILNVPDRPVFSQPKPANT